MGGVQIRGGEVLGKVIYIDKKYYVWMLFSEGRCGGRYMGMLEV